MRIIPITGITVHDIILIEPGRPDPDPTFKVVLYRNRDRADVPVVLFAVLESGAMSRPPRKSARFKRQGIGLRCKVISDRPRTYDHAVGVAAELGAGSAILQIIFSVMFGHPGAFDKRVQEGVVPVFAKSLPAVPPVLQPVGLLPGPDGFKSGAVQLDAVQRVAVAAAVVHIKAAIIVGEKGRIPTADLEGVDQRFPVVGFRIRAHPQRKLACIRRAKNKHRIPYDPYGGSAQLIINLVPWP